MNIESYGLQWLRSSQNVVVKTHCQVEYFALSVATKVIRNVGSYWLMITIGCFLPFFQHQHQVSILSSAFNVAVAKLIKLCYKSLNWQQILHSMANYVVNSFLVNCLGPDAQFLRGESILWKEVNEAVKSWNLDSKDDRLLVCDWLRGCHMTECCSLIGW